jgi:hypothetical protein
MGLGHWTFITLCGKEGTKITFITAYNASPAPRYGKNYHQQL